MNKIYNNVLEQLKEIVLKEKIIFRKKILAEHKSLKKYVEVEVDEYNIENKLYYSDGTIIYTKTPTINPIGFQNNNTFYIFAH